MSRLSPGRKLALKVTSQVRERQSFVQNAIESIVRGAKGISGSDKAFAELLGTGVVSTSGTLDEIIDRSLDPANLLEPNVRDAMRITAYELAFLGKQEHVAVDQGVELVRSVVPRAAGFGNMMLRRIARDVKGFPWGDPATDDEALARKMGFPYWMADMLIDSLGREEAAIFMDASNRPAPLFLAANSIKSTPDEVLFELDRIGADATFVGPKDRGCILVGKPSIAVRSKLLADGRAIVSDASAQLAALVAIPEKGGSFLEVGSGRGTKTVLLQSNSIKFNGEQSRIWCVDLHAFKNRVLERRLAQCGVERTTIMEGDATDLDSIAELPGGFRKALIDAPCSGIGTLRRHPEIRWRSTASDIDAMAQVGLAMLKSASRRIAPGGSMVFSTCTVTKEENSDVVDAFLASEEGRGWRLHADSGRPVIQNSLRPGGPDVHFIAQLCNSGT